MFNKVSTLFISSSSSKTREWIMRLNISNAFRKLSLSSLTWWERTKICRILQRSILAKLTMKHQGIKKQIPSSKESSSIIKVFIAYFTSAWILGKSRVLRANSNFRGFMRNLVAGKWWVRDSLKLPLRIQRISLINFWKVLRNSPKIHIKQKNFILIFTSSNITKLTMFSSSILSQSLMRWVCGIAYLVMIETL